MKIPLAVFPKLTLKIIFPTSSRVSFQTTAQQHRTILATDSVITKSEVISHGVDQVHSRWSVLVRESKRTCLYDSELYGRVTGKRKRSCYLRLEQALIIGHARATSFLDPKA